jgi:hypothetical protein
MEGSQKETLRDKLIIAFIQVLIFGALLAGLGYWFNLRLEAQKHALAEQSERTRAVLASLEPIIQLRRSAYLEFQAAARQAKNILEVYYFRAGEPSNEAQSNRLQKLINKMGRGSGGSGSSFVTNDDAIDCVRTLINLREKYEDIASDEIKGEVDKFIDAIMKDLTDGEAQGNDTAIFHEAAGKRLQQSFATLNQALEQALGFHELPIK